MAPETLTEILIHKENNYSFTNSSALQGRSIRGRSYKFQDTIFKNVIARDSPF